MKWSRDPVRTSGVGDPETTDLDRRAQDVVKFGVIKETDYTKTPPVYRIAIGDEQDEDNYILTDWLPASGGRANAAGDNSTHFLEVGEAVVMLTEGGELATSQVMPAGTYSSANPPTTDKPGVSRQIFKDGSVVDFDRETKKYRVLGSEDAQIVLQVADKVLIRITKDGIFSSHPIIVGTTPEERPTMPSGGGGAS